jgi:carbonic anhydrase
MEVVMYKHARALFVVVTVLLAATPVLAQTTPEWDAVMKGNRAFIDGYLNRDLSKRLPVSAGQAPPVAILSCSDSRVPPEVIFNRPIAQMFVVRTAGNVTQDFPTASLEYAVAVLSTKLIIVMGHESCGAIHSGLTPSGDAKLTPLLRKLVANLRLSFGSIPRDQWDARNAAIVRRATDANARRQAAQLIATSPFLAERVRAGTLKIVPAYYFLQTGVVEPLR